MSKRKKWKRHTQSKRKNANRFFIFYLFIVFVSSVFIHEDVHILQMQELGINTAGIRLFTIQEDDLNIISIYGTSKNYTQEQIDDIRNVLEEEAYSVQIVYVFAMLGLWYFVFRKKFPALERAPSRKSHQHEKSVKKSIQ